MFDKNDKVFRLNALYHRRDSTEWSDKEKKAYLKISQRPDFVDELSRIEQYFAAMKSDARHQFLRHDLITLLNNWTGELDRAANFKPQNLKDVRKHVQQTKQATKDELVARYSKEILSCQTRDEAISFVDRIHAELKDVVAEDWVMRAWMNRKTI